MSDSAPAEKQSSALSIEETGIEVIREEDRKGKPSDLFWPWFAANISVLSIPWGAWILGFGLSFWQAFCVALVGTVLSFLLAGIIAIAGKRGSAPTLTLSRAPFGVIGNGLPGVVSYLLTVGWEIILVVNATLATNTVAIRMGAPDSNLTKVLAFVVIVAVVVVAGVLGFDFIMKIQTWLTVILGVITIGYMALTIKDIDLSAVFSTSGGDWRGVLGATIMVMTGLGLGWVNCAADYSRYLPRSASSKGIVGWTTFSSSCAPIILIVYGLLLAGSNSDLAAAVNDDPIGALANILPTWYLIPFIIVSVGGLISGSVLDIYSSGLTLLSLGIPIKRWQAALLDGILMMLGTIWIVWFAANFFEPFQAFLITLGVPIAAWAGIFIGDMAVRKRDYDQEALFNSSGRYGRVNWVNFIGMIALTVIGWGLVTSSTAGFTWQGFLFGPLHLDVDVWGGTSVGVLVALLLGILLGLAGARRVRHQEERD
ncbi:MAG: allantoin permease [Actinomycetaceae bacterium]|nr:allantoin permease [Actinomycetaceae bacterium]